jgi:hypothetical protein
MTSEYPYNTLNSAYSEIRLLEVLSESETEGGGMEIDDSIPHEPPAI